MSKALTISPTKTNGAVTVLTKDQAADVDAIKTYHAASRKGAEDNIIFSFLCGQRIESLRSKFPLRADKKAGFRPEEGWTSCWKTYLPEIANCARSVHQRTFQRLNPLITLSVISEPKLLPGQNFDPVAKEQFLSVVHDNFDGKTITAIQRELGIVRKAKAPSGTGRKAKIDLDASDDDGSFLTDVRQDLLLLCNEADRTLQEADTATLIKFRDVHRAVGNRLDAILKRRKGGHNSGGDQ